MAPTEHSKIMNTLPLYLDWMPLHDRTRFAPVNKGDIYLFGSGTEKIHIYETDGGSNTYSYKAGVV
jgi:hypothetical protein